MIRQMQKHDITACAEILCAVYNCTNKYAPTPDFYRKNGFNDNELIMFIYKEMQ